MNRISTYRWNGAIRQAIDLLPSNFKPLIRDLHWWIGRCPVYGGLHNYQNIDDGHSYSVTSHFVYPHQQFIMPVHRRWPTLVLNGKPNLRTVLHELAHGIHAEFGWRPICHPVNDYARSNRFESFAESLTTYLMPELAYHRETDILLQDRQALELFIRAGTK